jgi:hypothetical protein
MQKSREGVGEMVEELGEGLILAFFRTYLDQPLPTSFLSKSLSLDDRYAPKTHNGINEQEQGGYEETK